MKRFSRTRFESNNAMLKCLTDIWTDIQFGVVTWNKLSTKSYSKRHRVSKFKKELIRDIVNSPANPTINDAIELYRDIRDPNRERQRRHRMNRNDNEILPIPENELKPAPIPDIDKEPTVFTPVYGTEYAPEEVAFPKMPDNVKRFREMTSRMADTYERKNADYGNSFTESIAEYGAVAGIVRIGDKFNRLKNLIKNPESQCVNDETIGDTLFDMANYCLMLKLEIDNKLIIF